MRVLTLLMVLLSTSALYGTEKNMTAETQKKNKEVVRRLYEEGFNAGTAGLDRFVDPDYAGAGDRRGPVAFAQPVLRLLRAFPDIHYTIEDLVAEGDRVVVRWTWKGTHTGDFNGIAPTQKLVT